MFRNLVERLKATPPWIWITIAIAAAGLVISFLIYRNSNQSANGQAGSDGVSPGNTSGGYSPYGNNSNQYQPDYATQSLLQQIINLLQGQQAAQASQGTPGISTPPRLVTGTVNAPAGTFQPNSITAPIQQPHPIGVTSSSSSTGYAAPRTPVIGAVNHADAHAATLPHPGAASIGTPHPLSYRQQGF